MEVKRCPGDLRRGKIVRVEDNGIAWFLLFGDFMLTTAGSETGSMTFPGFGLAPLSVHSNKKVSQESLKTCCSQTSPPAGLLFPVLTAGLDL